MSTIDPSSSRQATVADESEELAAEAAQQTSISASSAAVTTTTIEVNGNGSGSLENVNGQSQPEGKAPVNDEDEDEYDPNRIPDDACETLYLHNLNEKVRVPSEYWLIGESGLLSSIPHSSGRCFSLSHALLPWM